MLSNKELFDRVCAYTGFKGTKQDMKSVELTCNQYWYDTHDLSIYSKIDYVYIALFSYYDWSHRYIKELTKIFNPGELKTIIDFGAGIGASTMFADDTFRPDIIYYQNLRGKQWDFAAQLLYDNTNVRMVEDIANCGKVDMIFAFELFEHIHEPVQLLRYMVDKCHPKYICTANAFRQKAYGHWEVFEVDDKIIPNTAMTRVLHAEFKKLGYVTDERCLHPKFWNTRPRVWVKNDL